MARHLFENGWTIPEWKMPVEDYQVWTRSSDFFSRLVQKIDQFRPIADDVEFTGNAMLAQRLLQKKKVGLAILSYPNFVQNVPLV